MWQTIGDTFAVHVQTNDYQPIDSIHAHSVGVKRILQIQRVCESHSASNESFLTMGNNFKHGGWKIDKNVNQQTRAPSNKWYCCESRSVLMVCASFVVCVGQPGPAKEVLFLSQECCSVHLDHDCNDLDSDLDSRRDSFRMGDRADWDSHDHWYVYPI